MTDPFADSSIPGDPTDAVRLMSGDGSVTHLPAPGPVDPHMLWEGELTPRWQAWLRRGNGPYWLEGKSLLITQDTDTPEEEALCVGVGEWVTWCGDGFELGRVMPVFMRCGWESPEVRVGWMRSPGEMPALLRSMADAWRTTAAAESAQDEYERVQR